MKRISMSTTYTQSQIKIGSNRNKKNDMKIGMTIAKVKQTQEKKEKQSLNQSNCQLFGFKKLTTCCSSERKNNRVNSVNYHKLRYRRMSQKQMSNNKISTQTESMKQFFTDTKNIMPLNRNIEHYNTSSLSFITFSPQEARINSAVIHHAQPSFITNTTIQSLLTIPSTHYHHLKQRDLRPSLQIIDKKNLTIKVNSPRFSTLDSYRAKQNLYETLHSTISPHQLEIVSKLSESISVGEQDKKNKEIELRNMRNNKSLIRQLKSSDNSEEQSQQVNSLKTIRPQNLSCANRHKTLAQCANTIVSLYNKSSQKKSRLQESSVVFQGSKQVQNQEFISIELTQEVPINHNNNKFNGKTFLRTSRKSSPLEKTTYHYNSVEFDQIKFDANTFTEYGPL